MNEFRENQIFTEDEIRSEDRSWLVRSDNDQPCGHRLVSLLNKDGTHSVTVTMCRKIRNITAVDTTHLLWFYQTYKKRFKLLHRVGAIMFSLGASDWKVKGKCRVQSSRVHPIWEILRVSYNWVAIESSWFARLLQVGVKLRIWMTLVLLRKTNHGFLFLRIPSQSEI